MTAIAPGVTNNASDLLMSHGRLRGPRDIQPVYHLLTE